ncbi:malonyl-CoA synthase [Rhodobacterales bacterium 59_46_T64]|nr:malonyl-CoA synthase [Rhodobacterales bacterium 59_46_T64]
MANPLYDALFGIHAGKDTPFLISPEGETLTHGAFVSMAAQFAHALRAGGLDVGDRLAVQLEKSPQMLAIYAACTQAGVIFLPLNTAYTGAEVSYFVENSGAKLFLCDPARETELASALAHTGARIETLDAQGAGRFAAMADAQPDRFDTVSRAPDDLAAFLYTSGTTGRSKGAMMTHENLLSNARTLVTEWRFSAEDVLMHALPIFHTHGLFVASNVMLLAGGSMLFLPKFDLETVLKLMPQATAMMGVPTFYTRLLDDARFDRASTKHMRLFISGSAPLLAETHKQFEARTGLRILERYGMTETNMITTNPYEGERRAGTVGPVLRGVELKITDPETGAEMPDGEIGSIEVRGPNVFKGYWKMPEKTAEELRADGFFITGDLGVRSADGYVTLVGRGKDLIITGGFNVYPKEIEGVLDDQTGVLESAVIGVPHPDFGEAVVAVLVPEAGTSLDTSRIATAAAEVLAKFKQPKSYVVMDALPRNTMGKVQKNLLREAHADLFA